jgi:hypothetical protein
MKNFYLSQENPEPVKTFKVTYHLCLPFNQISHLKFWTEEHLRGKLA